MISGMTKIYGIIGDPVAYSLSPLMHNTAFNYMGLNCLYIPFKVKSTELRAAIEGIRALNIYGFNVTMPHKQTIIPLLDHLNPEAKRIGAVNTVVNDKGILTGYNTDAAGFIKALRENGIEPRGKKIIVFGAGGVAMAICFALAEIDCVISIVNRTIDRAWRLANLVSTVSSQTVNSFSMISENINMILDGADILVNATSIGMGKTIGKSIVKADLLNSSMVVFDTIYHPIETQLLKDAKKSGATVIGGVDMLIWQGVIAFKKWTGVDAPVEIMTNKLTQVIRNNED